MSETSSKLVEIGVVLQGGGALGAYECGAMNALLELMDEIAAEGRRLVLKVVTGVSIGAINAACVVGAQERPRRARAARTRCGMISRCDAPPFWLAAALRDLAYFGLPGFYAPRPDFWTAPTWTYVYNTRPLLATLERHVDFAALNTSPTAFVVTAVEVVTGELAARSPARPLGQRAGDEDRACATCWRAAACRRQFPWTEIDGMPYWDGGIVDNTPLGVAIDAFSADPEVDRMLVVMNLYPLRARLPRNLAGVEDRMHELSYGNRLRQDHDTARRINALVETIDDLAALVAPNPLDDRLQARLDEARRYKIIDAIVNIDMQDPAVTLVPAAQTSPTTRTECATSRRRPCTAGVATVQFAQDVCGPRSRTSGDAG